MTFQIKPITDLVGVEVLGLDLDREISVTDQQRLRALWADKGVVLFREAVHTPADHLRLSSIFGETVEHPVEALRLKSNPGLMVLVSDPKNRNQSTQPVEEVDGAMMANFTPWHKDLIYTSRINHGGLLRAVETPATGGATGFIDQTAAYQAMPKKLKQKVEGLSVVYQLRADKSEERFIGVGNVRAVGTTEIAERVRSRIDNFPRSVHPLVYRKADTGQPVLNFSPWFARYVIGFNATASDEILLELTDHCCQPHLAYHHQWKPDDAVLFDNWRVLHCAGGITLDQRRVMHRTTIPGDYGYGKSLHEAAAVLN